jgi:N-acetylmuramoyl-L-alanine amidase
LVLIYVDAGHGGRDSGATGNGLKEKDVTLDICKRIQKGLKLYENVNIIMSRSTDVFVSLEERTREANQANADILISIHVNAATAASAKGFETYIYPNSSSATVALQNVMHQEIIKAIGDKVLNRGKKIKNLHMLRESKMKAILTENLFISNAADAKLLADATFRQRIADAHISALEKFLGLKRNAQPPPQESTKYWTVQVGAFEEKQNALDLEKQLIKDGYRPFILEQ